MHDVSPERLRRFFVEEEGGYRISKSLREMVVFARQNLLSDPPFSRMDLISCRNLLIYLETGLQKKIMPTFHYALKPEGFCSSARPSRLAPFTNLFEPVDKKHKMYFKKPGPTPALQLCSIAAQASVDEERNPHSPRPAAVRWKVFRRNSTPSARLTASRSTGTPRLVC